jgi:predicted nuclease of predicted toxin-antitoxin system
MKVLLDENLPHELRPLLVGHEVFTVSYLKWKGLQNGELLERAAAEGFRVLVTTDRGIEYEQHAATLPCSVIVLRCTANKIEHLQPLVGNLLVALDELGSTASVLTVTA